MPLTAAWYAFCLGLAAGMTILAATAYAGLSPRWLRWLLLGCAAFQASRYATMLVFATAPDPEAVWWLRRCWLASAIALTLPGVIAADQLVRHPAMTPKKLLQRFSPFLAAYAVVLLFGRFELAPDPVAGAYPKLYGWARIVITVTQSAFVLGFCWIAGQLVRRLPSPSIRRALLGLMLAYAWLGVDGVLVSLGRWYVRPFLFSEMATLAAIWFALHTARSQTA